MLGLGWEDLQSEMVEKLGVDNVSMLDDAYESIEKWLETPAGIFTAMNDLVVQANERMKADQLYGEALNIGTIMLQHQLVNQVPLMLMNSLIPASGGFSSFIRTVYWLVRNGQDLLTVGTRLVSQAPNLTDPSKVNEVAGVVTDALKKVTVAMLDFAAVQIGVAKLPTDIGNALRGIRDKVQKRIQPLWSSVLDKGKKVRDQLVNAPPKADEASVTTGDIRGLIGKAVRVEKQNGQIHMLWASYNNGKIAIWMKNCAGEKQNLKELITKWEKGATKEEKADLEKVKESYQSLLKALQPLEKKMLEFEPKLQAAKGQREKAKVQAQYLKAIKKLDKGQKQLDELDNRLEVFGANAKACFAAGTPLLTPYGSKAIEKFVAGDEILSRDEYNPDGPVLVKIVEEVFERTGPVLNLHVAGQVIRTSGEHPFYVVGKDWTPANELQSGDLLVSHDGQLLPVEEVYDTGEWETLYNLRVSDFHTYFVGTSELGFSAWAHNQYEQFFGMGRKIDTVVPATVVGRNQIGINLRPFSPVPSLNQPQPTPPVPLAAFVPAAKELVLQIVNNIRSYMDGTSGFDSRQTTCVAIVLRNGHQEIWVSGSGKDSSVAPLRRQAIFQTLSMLGHITAGTPVYRIFNHDLAATTGNGGNRLDDAERHILRELQSQKSVQLLAIGSTIPVCTTCEPAIEAAGLAYAIAVPTVSGNHLTHSPGWTNIL